MTMYRNRVRNLEVYGQPMTRTGHSLSGRRSPRSLHPSALNTNLPLLVTPGTIVYVKSAEFDYQGPATNLQIGVGWKAPANTLFSPNPLDFNNGQNLIRFLDGGYGFSNLIGVPASGAYVTYTVTLTQPVILLAPTIGTNVRVSGATFSMSAGGKSDAWVWMYDVNQLGGSKVSPDTEFLVIDNDSGVIELKSAAAGQAVRDLDVEYGL